MSSCLQSEISPLHVGPLFIYHEFTYVKNLIGKHCTSPIHAQTGIICIFNAGFAKIKNSTDDNLNYKII